jgi:hypothetical protein
MVMPIVPTAVCENAALEDRESAAAATIAASEYFIMKNLGYGAYHSRVGRIGDFAEVNLRLQMLISG